MIKENASNSTEDSTLGLYEGKYLKRKGKLVEHFRTSVRIGINKNDRMSFIIHQRERSYCERRP